MLTIFLTLEQILVIHEDQIDHYGGSHGIRELTLLESALFRPQTTFSDQELYPTIFDKAAAMLHSLVMNHPFVDGNKRTGTAAMIIFLELNGLELKVTQKDLVNMVLQIEDKTLDLEQIAEWLEEHSQKNNLYARRESNPQPSG